jgi:hypothetical protein
MIRWLNNQVGSQGRWKQQTSSCTISDSAVMRCAAGLGFSTTPVSCLQLNEAQLSYSDIGGRVPRWPPGAAVSSRFQPPSQAAFAVQPPRLATHGGVPLLYNRPTPPASSLSATGSAQFPAAPPVAATDQQGSGRPAETADRDAARAGDKRQTGATWASNAPGMTARDMTPMPRTPATPEAAPRAHPLAVTRPPLSNLSSRQEQTAGSNPGHSAGLAAAVFGKVRQPIYRCACLIRAPVTVTRGIYGTSHHAGLPISCLHNSERCAWHICMG